MKQFILLALLLLVGCAQSYPATVTIMTENEEYVINTEVVTTIEEQEKGLMFRESLSDNEGMLFIFQQEQPLTFWMKNTLIPLDIIFIDKNYTINNIESATPCNEEPCEKYHSEKPSLYVLEVNKDYTKRNNIKKGDTILIERRLHD